MRGMSYDMGMASSGTRRRAKTKWDDVASLLGRNKSLGFGNLVLTSGLILSWRYLS
jgi:hypothetical protein